MSLLWVKGWEMVSLGAEYDFAQLSAGGAQTTGSPSTSLLEREDVAPPCTCRLYYSNGRVTECPHQATWVGLMRCCGYAKYLCDQHKEQWINPPPLIIDCRGCLQPFTRNPFAVLERL